MTVDTAAMALEESAQRQRSGFALGRALTVVGNWALAITAVVVFVSAAMLAAVHVADRYLVNQVSGAWMTLAYYVHHGSLYPPLHEAGRTFGTLYMPLPFVAHGGVSLITGEYLVSGKLTAYATALGLFALLFVLLRKVGCTAVVAAALVAAVVVVPAGYLADMSVRGDALSVVLQLAAVLVIWRVQTRRAIVGASILCALAVASKATAVWAPIAITIWLFSRNRRAAARFALGFVALATIGVIVLEWASGGHLVEDISTLAFSKPTAAHTTPLSGVSTFVHLTVFRGDAPWLLFGCALWAVASSARRRELSLFQVSLAVSLLVTVVVLRDPGADYNHLLDFSVLTALVVGEFWARPRTARGSVDVVSALLTTALVVGVALGYSNTMKADIGLAARLAVGHGSDARYSTQPLRGLVRPGDRILSEDPTISILSGRIPVTDPLTLPRLGKAHPAWIAELQQQVERRHFDEVVLIRPADPNAFHATQAFGRVVTRAIAANYRFKAVVPTGSLTYYVYVPR
jgi:hypothetical protein